MSKVKAFLRKLSEFEDPGWGAEIVAPRALSTFTSLTNWAARTVQGTKAEVLAAVATLEVDVTAERAGARGRSSKSRSSGGSSSSLRGGSNKAEVGPVGHPWAVAATAGAALGGGGGQSLGFSEVNRAALARLPVLVAAACLASLHVERGDKPLHVARDFGAAHALLAHGTSPNAHNADGQTPLFTAARCLDAPLAVALLRCGGDSNVPEWRPSSGWTSLQCACARPDALALVKDFFLSPKPRYLHVKAPDARGDPSLDFAWRARVYALLAAQADPNATDFLGSPPLFAAVLAKDQPFAELLLARGAELEIPHPELPFLHAPRQVDTAPANAAVILLASGIGNGMGVGLVRSAAAACVLDTADSPEQPPAPGVSSGMLTRLRRFWRALKPPRSMLCAPLTTLRRCCNRGRASSEGGGPPEGSGECDTDAEINPVAPESPLCPAVPVAPNAAAAAAPEVSVEVNRAPRGRPHGSTKTALDLSRCLVVYDGGTKPMAIMQAIQKSHDCSLERQQGCRDTCIRYICRVCLRLAFAVRLEGEESAGTQKRAVYGYEGRCRHALSSTPAPPFGGLSPFMRAHVDAAIASQGGPAASRAVQAHIVALTSAGPDATAVPLAQVQNRIAHLRGSGAAVNNVNMTIVADVVAAYRSSGSLASTRQELQVVWKTAAGPGGNISDANRMKPLLVGYTSATLSSSGNARGAAKSGAVLVLSSLECARAVFSKRTPGISGVALSAQTIATLPVGTVDGVHINICGDAYVVVVICSLSRVFDPKRRQNVMRPTAIALALVPSESRSAVAAAGQCASAFFREYACLAGLGDIPLRFDNLVADFALGFDRESLGMLTGNLARDFNHLAALCFQVRLDSAPKHATKLKDASYVQTAESMFRAIRASATQALALRLCKLARVKMDSDGEGEYAAAVSHFLNRDTDMGLWTYADLAGDFSDEISTDSNAGESDNGRSRKLGLSQNGYSSVDDVLKHLGRIIIRSGNDSIVEQQRDWIPPQSGRSTTTAAVAPTHDFAYAKRVSEAFYKPLEEDSWYFPLGDGQAALNQQSVDLYKSLCSPSDLPFEAAQQVKRHGFDFVAK